MVARAEIWWGETPQEKGRPFLVVSRDGANHVMQRVLAVPVTSRIRGIPSELRLGPPEGMPRECVAAFDNVRPIPKAMLTRRLGALDASRRHEICRVASATLDC